MLLEECPLRTRAKLVSIDVPRSHELRVQELGLRPGAELLVTQRAGFGGLVIFVAGSRLAVDRNSARNIHVELIEEKA